MNHLCLFIFTLMATVAAVANAEEKVVGVIIPMTGPYAHFGEAGRIGLELAVPASEAQRVGVRFIFEDSQYEASRAISAFSKLVEVDKAAAVIVLGSPPSSSIIPLAEQKRIPLFAWTPSKNLTGGKLGVVRLMSSAAEQGQKMADEARKQKYASVAYFTAQNEFSQSIRDSFLSEFGVANVPINEEFAPSEQDFRSALVRARLRDIEAIGVCLNTGQLPAFINQVRQLGKVFPVFGCHAMSSKEVLDTLTANDVSAWFVEGIVSKKFQADFQKISPDSSGIWLAAAFHDIGLMLSSVSLTADFLSKATSVRISNSAFGKSALVRGKDDTYLDVPLGITRMSEGRFVRENAVN